MSFDIPVDNKLSDFQILDSLSFESLTCNVPKLLNLQCPICESFKGAFVCCNCVKAGSLVNLGTFGVNSQNYNLLAMVKKSIDNVTERIKEIHRSWPSKMGKHTELTTLIDSIQATVTYLGSSNAEKRKHQHRIRLAMTKCHTFSQQLSKRQANLTRHFVTVAQRRKILVVELAKVNRHIKLMHDSLLEELLGMYFVTDLSVDIISPDRFVDSPLNIDKENIFIGPEPTPSSHTALTYCSIAIRVATILLDVWLPTTISRNLHLVGSFLSVLPQRDDMGRVYSAIIHAVHLLCVSRGIDIRVGLELLGMNLLSNYSIYNPLYGLYCLGHLVHKNNKSTRHFDDCFELKLNGFFGSLPLTGPPRQYVSYSQQPIFSLTNSGKLSNDSSHSFDITIEQGQEVNESLDLYGMTSTNNDNDQNASSNNILTPNITQINVSDGAHKLVFENDKNSTTYPNLQFENNSQSDCWELVSVPSLLHIPDKYDCNTMNSNRSFPLNSDRIESPTNSDVTISSLSKMWSLARGLVNNNQMDLNK